MQKIKVTVGKTQNGFSARADTFPVYTAGNSLEEIKVNIVEALNPYFEFLGMPTTSEDDLLIQ